MCITLLLAAIVGRAQETPTPGRLDTLSYLYYVNNEWAELDSLVPLAEAAGNDHYVWRIRVGVAHYYLEHYHDAVRDFEKALDSKITDQTNGEQHSEPVRSMKSNHEP